MPRSFPSTCLSRSRRPVSQTASATRSRLGVEGLCGPLRGLPLPQSGHHRVFAIVLNANKITPAGGVDSRGCVSPPIFVTGHSRPVVTTDVQSSVIADLPVEVTSKSTPCLATTAPKPLNLRGFDVGERLGYLLFCGTHSFCSNLVRNPSTSAHPPVAAVNPVPLQLRPHSGSARPQSQSCRAGQTRPSSNCLPRCWYASRCGRNRRDRHGPRVHASPGFPRRRTQGIPHGVAGITVQPVASTR